MTVEQLLAAIIGPFGALVVLVLAVYIAGRAISELWTDHKRGDTDDRDQRDKAIARLEGMVGSIDRNTAAVDELAKAFSAYITEQARRNRRRVE